MTLTEKSVELPDTLNNGIKIAGNVHREVWQKGPED